MRRAIGLVCVLMVLASSCAEVDRGVGGPAPSNATTSAASSGPSVWPLRGTPAPNADAIRARPIVVKVAGDAAARPQSGLSDADVILEIPVEGGLTRLSLVFHSKDPGKVGPVRSARQSDLQYVPALGAILAHVGASEQVTKLVRDAAKTRAFVDVDEFEHADAFERVSGRVAPYNAYTTGAKLRQAGGSDKVNVPALPFGDTKAAGTDGAALTVPYSEPVQYTYNGKAYSRTYPGGAKTVDDRGEVPVDNVVVISTDVTQIAGTADAAGAPSVDYRGTGTGPVVVLREGKRYTGTWSRKDDGMYTFKDESGAAILLKPGLTWIHIVPMDMHV